MPPRRLPPLLLFLPLLFLPTLADASTYVDASSSISVDHLSISDPNGGTLYFADEPYLDVRVWSMAKNSLGEYQDNWDSQNAFVDLSKSSAVTWASGQGSSAAYSTGIVSANSVVKIPPDHIKWQWAYGEGMGSLGQWFYLTGVGGATDATVSVDYSGSQYGSAGDGSTFWTQAIAGLELWDYDGNRLMGETDYYTIAGGPNQIIGPIPIAGSLGGTLSLDYDAWYYVYYEADSETRGDVPEPPTVLLLACAVALVGARRRVRR